ncbi:MAG: hypothetical protein PHQ93_00420 [Sulfurimonas sp.]|uniref:hypothetical protein n=1 Tax=Sulfurimonas sp. TaxID=2022749 RepID=UPI00261EAD34|nr:hypothetical protein [Sulfurimonas sp.]MDD5399636.1 hypothetical protein [Sulfurimonas sp.]
MHTLTLNVKDNAYNNIIYFLKNLSADVEIVYDKKIAKENEKISQNNLKGVFHRYCDISKIDQEDEIVKKHVINNYKKENF